MRKVYNEPELEIVNLEWNEIITTSPGGGLTDGGDDGTGNGYNFGDIIKP